MIHLEGFNIFKKKEKKIEEELYKRVEYDEVQTFSESHKEELINKHEFDTLSNLSRDIRKSIIRRISNGEHYGVRFGYKSKYCELTKYEDEWFVLKTVSGRDQFRPQGISRYYICDTIEGAIQAICFGYSGYNSF